MGHTQPFTNVSVSKKNTKKNRQVSYISNVGLLLISKILWIWCSDFDSKMTTAIYKPEKVNDLENSAPK